MKHPLKTLNKKRLQRWLLLFFLALLIPTALLIQQSYSRLKWETFHQHQLMAAELSERIDKRLIQMINAEDQRPFNDFSFLKTPEAVHSKVIQRSPLSEFPVRSDIPGLLGYFQVDASGQLLTPILPTGNKGDYGIPATELSQRIDLQNEILGILAANKLAEKSPVSPSSPTTPAQQAPLVSDMQNNIAEETLSTLSSSEMPAATMAGSAMEAEGVNYSFPASIAQQDSLADAMPESKSADRKERATQPVVRASKAEAPAAKMKQAAPIAFDQLREISKKSAKKKDLGRVEDLKLQQNYLQKESESAVKRQSARLQKQATSRQRQARPAVAMTPPVDSQTRIRTFESEIDPFEFSQLDSGHFVLFRKVWLNGQRYTQGLLIDQNRFLAQTINDEFIQTSLSAMSDLLVAYQGNVLTAFSAISAEQQQNYQANTRKIVDTQRGEQLYQIRLSDPVSDLQLIYSITQLPIGSGGQLLLWLSLVLGVVLLGGFYLMYRLGLGQINLANQQQDFVSAVSHELKTPLTSIRMYGELLREGWATEEKKKTYYQFIFDESERLTRLINNVLQLARMTRNEQKAELAERNVAELVQEIKSRVSSQIEAAEFTLEIEADASLATILMRIDSDWLIQIMINLVDNALKFSAKAKQKTIILGVERIANHQVKFSINDFGPGIDQQQMKKIFELFYRSENELTRDTVGTGIGLSLVHQMATGMGGKVGVENRGLAGEFSGAAFSVVFPVIKSREEI